MADRQLQRLNRSRLSALREEECYLRLEPFTLSEKKVKKMRAGDTILLGKRPPALEIACNGEKVASAIPAEGGIRVAPPEDEDLGEVPGPKSIRLEGRLGLLPDTVFLCGDLLELPWLSLQAIELFDEEGRHRALAALVVRTEGFALDILELSHG
ncbi:hypothetical protein [Nitratifractor sp.]